MNSNDYLQILKDLIELETVNGKEDKVARYLQKLLYRHGIHSERIEVSEGRDNLVASIGSGNGPHLAISGHFDVVAPGDLDQWDTPPFEPTIKDGKMYGRGTTDMKAGVAALIIAMIEVFHKAVVIPGTITFLGTVGEEVGQLGAEQLTQLGYLDQIDGLLIAEPSSQAIVYKHKGSINYTLTSVGKEAHSSMPELGDNAIENLLGIVPELNQAMNRIHKEYEDSVLGRHLHNITLISGGEQINSIPKLAQLQGNIRTIPAYDNDQVIADLEQLVHDYNKAHHLSLELVIDYDKPAVDSNSESELIQSIQAQLDEPLPVVGFSGTTDAAEFSRSENTFDLAVYGPGQGELAHKVNEYVDIDNYLEFIERYQAIFMDYLQK